MNVQTHKEMNYRTGSILAVVLVTLLVASMLGLALIRSVSMHQLQMRRQVQQNQCVWLAEAGLQRAGQKLADMADYRGETWEMDAATLGGSAPAVVTIEVLAETNQSEWRTVRVEARLADPRMPEMTCQREWAIPIPRPDPTKTTSLSPNRSPLLRVWGEVLGARSIFQVSPEYVF